MMNFAAAKGYLEKAMIEAGKLGPTGSKLAASALGSNFAVKTANKSDYLALRALGKKRLIVGGGAVSGAMVLNAARAPSSGNEGLMPGSMGGTTGGY